VWHGAVVDYIAYLRADAARLRQLAARQLELAIPSWPGWTVGDLIDHVAGVYAQKTAYIRMGNSPEPRPAMEWAGFGSDPLARYDRMLAELLTELERHAPDDPATTGYPPDQTVGFLMRRTAHETAVHRVDVELAVGHHTAVAAPLAEDGVDELLTVFLGWNLTNMVARGGTEAVPALKEADGRAIQITAAQRTWTVRPTPDGVQVQPEGTPEAAATVTGSPSEVLLWLWNRRGDEAVTITGDTALITFLKRLLSLVPQ